MTDYSIDTEDEEDEESDTTARVAEILRSPGVRASLLAILESTPSQACTLDIEHALESEGASVLAELCKEVSAETRARWDADTRAWQIRYLKREIPRIEQALVEGPEPVLEEKLANLQTELRALGGSDNA